MLGFFNEKVSLRREINLKRMLHLIKRILHLHSKTNGAIAQSVEQRTENPCVPGSNPGGTTSKAFRSKSEGFRF